MESELAVEFDSFLSRLPKRGAVIVTHRNADPDAAGAAIGVAEAALLYGSKPIILAPEGLSKASRRLAEAVEVDKRFAGDVTQEIDTVIIVDTASPGQLAPFDRLLEKARRIIAIDHHASNMLSDIVDSAIILPSAASTSEIVAYAGKLLRIAFSWRAATMLYAGILSDSRMLRISGPFTAEALAYLLDMGARTGLVSSVARDVREKDTSERIALLKAASRLRYARACKNILVAVTHVGSFEASAARALIELGADVAAVAKDSREGVRVSVRVSQRALSSSVSASSVAKYIGEKLGGEAGGHESAAGVIIRGQALSAEDVAERIARSLPGRVARMCVEARRSWEDQ